jgi:Ca2+-transporting ATPase
MLCLWPTAGACQYWGQRSKCLFTLEFDRVRKSMSVIVKEVDGQRSNKLLVKVHS